MFATDWSGWDWTASIERYSREIGVLLAGLFALMGMAGGAVSHRTVSRRRRLEVLSVLRPLEAALRRVIVMALVDLPDRGVRAVPRGAPPVAPVPAGGGDRPAPFALFDARRRVGIVRRTVPERRAPRIWFFDGSDPPRETWTPPSDDDVLDAGALVRRLLSAKAALSDIPAQARRMARAIARRRAAGRPVLRPMRHARPPGHRADGKRPVDRVLAETHDLACIAMRGMPPAPP